MFLYVVELFLGSLVVILLVSQVIVPLAFGTQTFPLARRTSRKLDRERTEAVTRLQQVAMEQEIQRLRREVESLNTPPPKPSEGESQ